MTSSDWLKSALDQGFIKRFDYSEFENFQVIGNGGYGTVRVAYWRGGGIKVALKELNDVNFSSKIIDELRLLQKVSFHPNINQFYGVTEDSRRYIIVLQYAKGGNLRDYLSSKIQNDYFKIELKRIFNIARDITLGLKCMHQHEIVHRDLHSKNILIHKGNAQIADFGLAKQLNDTTLTSKPGINGMAAYIEPQCFLQDKNNYRPDKRSDIYSLGVLFWELTSGIPPFDSCRPDLIPLKIILGNREKKVSGTPSSYSNLYKNCWTSDPRKRPTLDYILKILANLLNYSGENLITNYIGHDNSISQKSIIYSLLVSQKNPNKSIAGIIDDQSCIIENSFDILNSVNKITKIPERKERVKKTSKKISKKLKISSAPYHRDSVHIKKGSNDEVSQHIQNVIHMEGDVLIPDIIDFNLKVLFVEINPGNSSAETGHNFAHESNHFYPCLIESGITNNEYVTYMDDRSFPTRFKIGIVNAVNRCTNSNAKNLSNAEKYNSIEPLLKKVKKYKPKILCFVGKMIFDSFVKYCKNNGLQSNRIFWNDQNGFTKVFAMPSTSARVKSYEKSDKLRYFKELKILMDQ